MSQISLTLLRLGFLVLLWALVLSAIAVLRADIYGTRVLTRGRGLTRSKRGKNAPGIVEPTRIATGLRAVGAPKVTQKNESTHIAVITGPLRGTTIPLGNTTITIGRASNSTLVLEDDYCSAKHAQIYRELDEWLVEDLGSTNGTFLDGSRITDPVPLRTGSRLKFGVTTLEMRQ